MFFAILANNTLTETISQRFAPILPLLLAWRPEAQIKGPRQTRQIDFFTRKN
jgi:hypothetical protein